MSYRFGIILLCIASLLLNTVGIVKWNAGAPYDTAHKGIETIEEVLQGNIKPFYRHYNGQPPLMDWLLAPLFLFFGVSAYTLHGIGIATAVLTTLLLYIVGKALWSSRAGMYASLFGTTSHWLLLEAREGTHNIPLVPLLLLIFWCVILIFQKTGAKRYYAAVVGGITAGLFGYVYSGGWIYSLFFLIAFPLLTITTLYVRRWRSKAGPLALCTIMMFTILFPFYQFIAADPRSVLSHADDEIRTRDPLQAAQRVLRNSVPTLGAFTYIFISPFSNWENNGLEYIGSIPLHFPVPFVSPGAGVLVIGSILYIGWGLYKKKPISTPVILIFFIALAVSPNLLTIGPQPHYRRTVCAMVPLFLLLGWCAGRIHEYIEKRNDWKRIAWNIFLVTTLLYGPILYFFVIVDSSWFAKTYQTHHDRVAPYLFSRIAKGQKVTLAGNTAHMKPFQFYALATEQGQDAFTLLDLHTAAPFPEEVLEKTDVLFYVYAQCDELSIPGFVQPPTVLRSKFGVDGCVFDRPGTSQELIQSRVPLPSSKPLLHAFLNRTTPLKKHEAFRGLIYGN